MARKKNDLKIWDLPGDINNIRYRGDVDLDAIVKFIEEKNDEMFGYDISVGKTEISAGSLFNKSIEEGICIMPLGTNTSYFTFIITTRKQGKMTVLTLNYTGYSDLTSYKRTQEDRKNSDSIASNLIGFASSVKNGSAKEQAFQEEYDYYSAMAEIFGMLAK